MKRNILLCVSTSRGRYLKDPGRTFFEIFIKKTFTKTALRQTKGG